MTTSDPHDRHAAVNVTQYLLNNGLESLRSPRA
jgi:hypothetical protein